METIKMSLCPVCGACPWVVIDVDGVTIGEKDNMVRLSHAEWNQLVDPSSVAGSFRRRKCSNRGGQHMTLIAIGQLGRKVGLRPSAIRYYEAQGVLGSPGRSANGYRVYGPQAVVLLRFICRSKELGFTLEEIRQLIETSRSKPPCALTRKPIERHLGAVEGEIRRLNSLRDRLKRAMHQPAPGEGANGLCPLIESSR